MINKYIVNLSANMYVCTVWHGIYFIKNSKANVLCVQI